MTTIISDEELAARFPDVLLDHDNRELYRGWLERKLNLNRCSRCGTWHHPPKPICPNCWSFEIEPTTVSGRGTVYFLVMMHQGPPAPGVDYSAPHPAVTVELEEQTGLRYTSTLVNYAPDDLIIGRAVELTWIARGDAPFPVFRPRPEGSAA